jgi:hypothetical protein
LIMINSKTKLVHEYLNKKILQIKMLSMSIFY